MNHLFSGRRRCEQVDDQCGDKKKGKKKTGNHANRSHCRCFWKNMAARDMIDGRPKREAVAAWQTLWIWPPFFLSGQGGNAANSCFSAAGKNENALFICRPSIMNLASAKGVEENGPVWGVCASEKRQYCKWIHVTYFICLVWPARGLKVSLKFLCGARKRRQWEQRASSSERHKDVPKFTFTAGLLFSFKRSKKFAACLRSRFKMNCRSIYPPHALFVLD